MCSLVCRLLCVSREKKAWNTLFVHAHFPEDFWELWKFPWNLLNYFNLHKACRLPPKKDTCHWPRFVWRNNVDTLALRLQELSMCPSILAKCYGTQLTQSFPLKLTNRLEWSNADSYRQVILFLTSKLPKGVSQAIIGVSLSEPHTSGTPLSMCVCI